LTVAGDRSNVADSSLELVSESNLAKVLAIDSVKHHGVTHDPCAFESANLIHRDDRQLLHVSGTEPGDDRSHTDKLICAIITEDESGHPVDRVVLLAVCKEFVVSKGQIRRRSQAYQVVVL